MAQGTATLVVTEGVVRFTPLNAKVVAVTIYPGKGQRCGWPRSTSRSHEHAAELYRRLKARAI